MNITSKNNKFSNIPNLKFTEQDQKAQNIFNQIQQNARKQMPKSIYTTAVMTHYQEMKKTQFYSILKTIPKGALHHCHIDCNEDKQFYRNFIINDPIIYLSSQRTELRVGTKKQAQQNGWISLIQLRKQFQSEDRFVDYISNQTMFNKQEHQKILKKQITFWSIFQQKIINFFAVLYSLKHFKLYMKYICQKYINNGYDRLQFRSMLSQLMEYDEQGNLIKKHPEKKFASVIDQVCEQISQSNPSFSLGVIFFGLKMFNDQQNGSIFTNVCQLNWNKAIGVDIVQEEDPYGSLKPYNQTVDRVLSKYPLLNLKKVYHAGQTRNSLNQNIQIAVKAGSVRIGHGINIIQRLQFLSECKNVCFQISPVSNMLAGYRDDLRIGSATVLMSLGIPLSINPDDPGKFGYQDSTVDYFCSMISFDWGLRQLKTLGIYSINHAICSQEQKQKLLISFNKKWNNWIQELIKTN